MSDGISDIKPWTVRNISPEVRNEAIMKAKQEKMPVGAWIERAIKQQCHPLEHSASRLSDIQRVVEIMKDLSACGTPPPEALAHKAYMLLNAEMSDILRE